jgi:hypothetical protein
MAGERLTIGFLDYSNEPATFATHVGAVTAVSLPGLLTQIAAYIAAVDAITLGTIRDDTLVAYSTNRSSIPPVDIHAQRERKWLVRYVDDLPFFDDPVNAIPNAGFGQTFTITIPTADISSGNLIANTDLGNLADTQMAAFVTAFEALARSPYGGTVQVISMEAVGSPI